MKKNLLKRIGAVALALAVSLTMGTSAFAANNPENPTADPNLNGDGNISDAGVVQDYDSTNKKYNAVGSSVRIDKEIVIFNTRSDKTIVYLPNVKFSYAIAPVTDLTEGTPKITDEFGISGKVKKGVAAALGTTSATIEYSNTDGIKSGNTVTNSSKYVTTSTNGAAAAGYFDISFTAASFGAPGIYRYKITESEDSTLTRAKAGVTNNSYKNVRYLDVYVQNGSDGLEIYGYVLFEAATDDQNTSFDAKDKKLTAKTNGFVSDKNDGATSYSNTETDVDLYLTSNAKILKTVDGTLGDKNNKFPFAATVSNDTIKSNPIISYQVVGDNGTLNTASTSNSTATMTNGTATWGSATSTVAQGMELNDADYVYIYGIPGKNVASKITTSEYNNTKDTYTVTAKYDDGDVNVSVDESSGASKEMDATKVASLAAAQTIDNAKAEDVVNVINAYEQVSPTNVVMRFAPYLFILGAAIVLLVLMRRRRASQDAE